MKLRNDGPEDRYRASVKTAIIVHASKYSFCRLFSQRLSFFFFPTSDTWWSEVKDAYSCSLNNNITAITKLTHNTASVKALLTATWNFPVRNSTTEESASGYSHPVSDLFMRGTKQSDEEISQVVSSCVFCAPRKCFGFIHSQPADYSGVLAPVCIRNSHLQGTYLSTSVSSATTCWVFKAFCLHCNPLLWESLCNLNCSYSALIAQTCAHHMDQPANTWCSARVSLW